MDEAKGWAPGCLQGFVNPGQAYCIIHLRKHTVPSHNFRGGKPWKNAIPRQPFVWALIGWLEFIRASKKQTNKQNVKQGLNVKIQCV